MSQFFLFLDGPKMFGTNNMRLLPIEIVHFNLTSEENQREEL